jgi:hypothetical protein
MIYAVLLFLLLIALLGIGGKWLRLPPKRSTRRVDAAGKCSVCRAYTIGRPPAPCSRPDCPYR